MWKLIIVILCITCTSIGAVQRVSALGLIGAESTHK